MAVHEYKFYFLEIDGHISRPPAVKNCADDREAMDHGRQLNAGYDIEIWQERRLLASIPLQKPSDGQG